MSVAAIQGVILEGGGCVLLARILGYNGEAITQASISTIAFQVSSRGAPPGFLYPTSSTAVTPALASTGTFVVADTVFDTLQTDDRWSVDTTGYNFAATLTASQFPVTSASTFPDSGWARVDILMTPTSGGPFAIAYDVEMIPSLYGKV